MTDEDVIRRRLLIDGDGTGDDRRLNNLIKSIIKWTNTTGTEQEDELMYDRLLSQLGLCEFASKRAKLLTRANDNQLNDYKKLQKNLEKFIIEAKTQIECSKGNLEQAKILKRHRMQYDILAQNIKEQPARSDTDRRLAELKSDLNELTQESHAIDHKLDLRRKQFFVLVSSANQLRTMLEDSVDDEDAMNTSLDDITNSPGPEPMSE